MRIGWCAVVLVVGCGSTADGGLDPDGGVPVVTPGAADAGAAGADPDSGGAQPDATHAPDGAQAPLDGSATPDATSAKADAMAVPHDVAPVYPACAPYPLGTVTDLGACGVLGSYRFKDGILCASCAYMKGGVWQHTAGCRTTITIPSATPDPANPMSALCVASCGECK